MALGVLLHLRVDCPQLVHVPRASVRVRRRLSVRVHVPLQVFGRAAHVTPGERALLHAVARKLPCRRLLQDARQDRLLRRVDILPSVDRLDDALHGGAGQLATTVNLLAHLGLPRDAIELITVLADEPRSLLVAVEHVQATGLHTSTVGDSVILPASVCLRDHLARGLEVPTLGDSLHLDALDATRRLLASVAGEHGASVLVLPRRRDELNYARVGSNVPPWRSPGLSRVSTTWFP
jgi:hypothetical protein